MNDIGVIGGADGTTQIVVSGSIGGPILWIFFGALALMVSDPSAHRETSAAGTAACQVPSASTEAE